MLFRIIKRSEISKRSNISIRIAAIILALLASSIFIIMLNKNPIDVYMSMVKGAFGSSYRIQEVLKKAIPLCITALGVAVAFKMKFWNIGADGQIMMGAFLASFFALKFPDMNKPVLLIIMIIAGIIGGSIWALIPAIFKSKWGTNETIITLMMNYVAIKWIVFLQYGPWKDPKAQGFPKIANFSENAILPDFPGGSGLHMGWIFTLALVIFIYIFMKYTKKGFETAVLGESEKTAIYAGVNIKKTIITTILLSGGLCGLTGMIQASAVSNTLSAEISGGVGYTAIIVAWLSNLSAPIIMIVSVLFAALVEGGSFIQTAFGIPEAVALILQAMILFFVLGSEFFIKYKVALKKENNKKNIAVEQITVAKEVE